MKKHIFLFVLLFLLCGASLQAQLLWRISGNGLQKPSYLLGISTYAPMESIDEIPGLRAVYDATEQVCGVVAVTDSSVVEKISLELPKGTTLMSLFKEDDQLLLRSFIKKFYFLDVEDSTICHESPSSLLIGMEQVDLWYSAEEMYDFMRIGHTTFSDSLQRLALERNIPVKGLVSKATNLDYAKQKIYLDMPIKRQKKFLLDYVLNFSKKYESMIQDIEAYQTLNLDSINRCLYISNMLSRNFKKVIYREIKEWSDNIPPIIETHSTLIVLPVYALLDFGKNGSIMQQLRNQGYTVEAFGTRNLHVTE